jgi:UDP-glucoronosyl and UDP-glucosyl transferase
LQDIKDWLDSSRDGFILFSLGTNIKSSKLPQERIAAILKVLSKLKVKVLWKFEKEDLPGRPENVKISKWLSQQDVLGTYNQYNFIFVLKNYSEIKISNSPQKYPRIYHTWRPPEYSRSDLSRCSCICDPILRRPAP